MSLRIITLLPVGMFVLAAACAGQVLPPNNGSFAFTNITVIDATGAPAKQDVTVVVTGNRITAIARKPAIPKNALVIDARGKFMIPGLWDMHTHVFIRSRKSFPLYVMYLLLAHGVTGVRDMGSPGERDDFGDYPYLQDLQWRQAIEEGAILGPRLNLALTILNGPHAPGYPRNWFPVAGADQARKEVDDLKTFGADLIKVYDQLSPEAYFAIADESKKRDLPFAGHVPILVTAAQASDAGQRSLEHDYSVLFGCSTREQEFIQKENELYGAGKPVMRGLLPPDDVKALVSSYSPSKAAELFSKLVKNNTFVTPTLQRAAPKSSSNPNAKYFSPALLDYVYPPDAPKKEPSPAMRESERLMFAYHKKLVKEMQVAGVKLLAGTDTSFFGSDLQDELVNLVTAGLTPMQALQTATKNAADYLGKLESLGTVEDGKLADLVVLDANPLEDIENVRKVSAVVINGRLLDRKMLDGMLDQVESTSRVSSNNH